MDIFESSLSCLDTDIVFNEDNTYHCKLTRDDDSTNEPLLLSFYRNTNEMSLSIAVMTRNTIPDDASPELFTAVGEAALQPLRGGPGVGIFPGTKNLAVYQVVYLAGKPEGYIMATIESLIKRAEEWDKKLCAFSPRW